MKSTTEILDEIAIRQDFENWQHFLEYTEGQSANLTSVIQQAMITYAEQVRDEDRKIILENIKIDGYVDDYYLHEDSIINTPKQELK